MLHSKLGASSAKRWMNCPGSLRMIEKSPPQQESKYAAEGTAAHELAEIALKKGWNPSGAIGKEIAGFTVTEEMADAVAVYVDYVVITSGDSKILIEEKFDLSHIYEGMFGTNDACSGKDYETLHVFDYKHGAGVPVEAENNPQLLYYAIGASKNRRFKTVKMHIVQPRAIHPEGPIRTLEVPFEYLHEFSVELKKAGIRTQEPDAYLAAGEWCRFCPALGLCPEVHRKTSELAKTDFADPHLPPAETLSNEQLSEVINHETLIKNFLDDVKKQAYAKLMSGEKIEGLKLVRKRGSRKWKDEPQLMDVLKRDGMLEDAFTTKLKTPAQLEKTHGKEFVKQFVDSIQGDITLATENDKRKAVNPDPALDFRQ